MFSLLGVKIDNLSLREVLERVESFMRDNKQHYIVTVNPEFLVLAQKDKDFRKILNKADLSVPDGIGIVFASLLKKNNLIRSRVTGVDLFEEICYLASMKNWNIFLYGAREETREEVKNNLLRKYPELRVNCLSENGFLNDYKINDLNTKGILFVALGAAKQEKWINENLENMPNIKLAVGVGGTFDFISGNVSRAPVILRKIGLEWLWRLIIQPKRFPRIINAVIIFPFLVIKEIIKNSKFQITNYLPSQILQSKTWEGRQYQNSNVQNSKLNKSSQKSNVPLQRSEARPVKLGGKSQIYKSKVKS